MNGSDHIMRATDETFMVPCTWCGCFSGMRETLFDECSNHEACSLYLQTEDQSAFRYEDKFATLAPDSEDLAKLGRFIVIRYVTVARMGFY